MIIGRVKYDSAGRLQAPLPIDLKLNVPLWNSPITLDEGSYHRIRISAKTEDALQARIRAAHRLFQATRGLSVLSIDKRVVLVGNRRDIVLDVVYVVERPRGAAEATRARATTR